MTTSYSTNLGLALPVQGELAGTWGDTVNNGITNYTDIAVAGTQTISGSQTAVTLSLTNGSASASNIAQVGAGPTGTAQYAIINCIGNPAGLLTITVPASSRQYIVLNATSTSQSVKVVGAGPTTGVTIVSGERAHIAWNGSDFVKVASSLVSQLSGVLAVANGGTGATTNSTARTNLGATTLGSNLFTITNPSAITFPRFNADNTVSALSASDFRTAIGAGTGGGDVSGPASSVSGNIATFNGTTGKIIQDGGKALPTGTIVGTTDTQTLTNKTLTSPVISTISNTGTLTLPTSTDTLVGRATTDTLTNKTLDAPTINNGYTEEVFAVSGTTPALSPTNGSIQTWTLTGNSTPTAGTWAAGQSLTLMVDDGTAYTITWTSLAVTWKTNGGTAPTLNTTGDTAIQLWKVGTTIYGARVGDA